MLAKIVISLILLIGVINPRLSIKLFEFWKLGRKSVTDNALKATRIFSVIAIILVWMLMP
jgi:hypothetical protein